MPPGIERFNSHDGQGDAPRQIIGQQSVQTSAEGVKPVIGSAQPAERLPARKVPVLVPQTSRKTDGSPQLAISDNHEVSVEVPHGIIETVLFTQEVKQEPVEEQVRDVIDRIRNGIPISWAEVSGPTKKGLLERIAADEGTGIPASMLESSDIEKKRDLLGGHSLRGLYTNTERLARDSGEDTMTVLHRETGLERTADDVTTAIKLDRVIRWKFVPDTTKAEFMQRAAAQTGIPASLMGPGDFRVAFDFLDGRALQGLYSHFITAAKAAEQETVQYITEKTGLVPTGDDVVQAMQHGRDIDWKRIPPDGVKGILEIVAADDGTPASLITQGGLIKKRGCLGGRSLEGLYHHVNTAKPEDDTRDSVAAVLELAGITVTGTDVINGLRAGKQIYWQRVPKDALREVLVAYARDENIDSPPSLLRETDFVSSAHSFGNRGLNGLYLYAKEEKPEGRSTIPYLMEKAGLTISADDAVEGIKKGRQIPWERLPAESIKGLLTIVAEATDISIASLEHQHLRASYPELGGRSIRALLEYALRHRPDGQSGIAYLKEKVGITHIARRELHQSLVTIVADVELLMPLGIRSSAALAAELGVTEGEAAEALAYIRKRNGNGNSRR